jgi:hypothetical protein
MEYNCLLIKVAWLALGIALRVDGTVLVVYLWRWRKICTILKPIRKQGPIPEEMSQTPLTTANIIKPTQTRINLEECTFCIIKSLEHQKNVKNWLRPLFRPRTDHVCHQKLNPSRETVLLTGPHPTIKKRYVLQLAWVKS